MFVLNSRFNWSKLNKNIYFHLWVKQKKIKIHDNLRQQWPADHWQTMADFPREQQFINNSWNLQLLAHCQNLSGIFFLNIFISNVLFMVLYFDFSWFYDFWNQQIFSKWIKRRKKVIKYTENLGYKLTTRKRFHTVFHFNICDFENFWMKQDEKINKF